jgi:hypothetical protein
MSRREVDEFLSKLTAEERQSAKNDLDGLDKRLFKQDEKGVRGFPELDELVSGTQRLRDQFKNLGYPFMDGQIIMKVETLKKFVALKEEVKRERERLVSAFIAAYPTAILPETVNSKFYDSKDYRPVEALRGMFGFKTPILGFASEALLAEQVNEAALMEERTETVNLWKEVREEGMKLVREQIAELTTQLVESVSGKADGTKRKFHASTLEKLNEFFASFEDRNLAGDDELKRVVEQLKALVGNKTVQDFKNDKALQEKVRTAGGAIQQTMQSLLVSASARVIKLTE